MGPASAIALVLALEAGVVGVAAVPAVLRTAAVALALFTLCGLAPALVLVRGRLAESVPLFVLPLGAAVSSLGLTLLGLAHLPLTVGLVVVCAGSLLALLLVLHRSSQSLGSALAAARTSVVASAAPLLIAAIVGLISLLPVFRSGFATVPGQNPDAALVVGSAVLLEHSPPTATRPDLPVNHVPLVWRSKYPIYYALAGVSALAGQDPIAAFPTLCAIVLALAAVGFFLVARHMLRAPPWISLAALFLVGIDRIVVYVTVQPFYNELWATFTLPFILLTGWRYLTEPGRATAAAFVLFAALGLLVYPLLLPFPLLFLGGYAWLTHRRERAAGRPTGWISSLSLPRVRSRAWSWVLGVPLTLLLAAVLVRGVIEKLVTAGIALAPGGDLINWRGGVPYFPFGRFVGVPGSGAASYAAVCLICGLALLALRAAPGDVRRPLGWMVIITAIAGIYFRLRRYGELFDFRDLAFLGPIVLTLAVVQLGRLLGSRRRLVLSTGAVGLGAAFVAVPIAASQEINRTFDNATAYVLELRTWSRALPAGASIRLDVPPIGMQMWATYMLHEHPLSALEPLGGFYPHPPRGRKARYVLTMRFQPRPVDAIGPPLLANAQFELWRMNPAVPGPDRSRRGLLDDYTKINY